jgi:hypothetical protein
MIEDEKRKNVAEQLLKNGWIEATPENIKAYMDGFEMAKNKNFEEPKISSEEYLKRLRKSTVNPIHIITRREIVESDEKNGVSQERCRKC